MREHGCVYLYRSYVLSILTLLLFKLASSIKENPKLRAAAEELKKAGHKVSDAVSETLKTMEESDVMRAVSLPKFPFL